MAQCAQSVRLKLLSTLKEVYPAKGLILKLGELAKLLASALKSPLEGVTLSESDETFTRMLDEVLAWLQREKPKVDTRQERVEVEKRVMEYVRSLLAVDGQGEIPPRAEEMPVNDQRRHTQTMESMETSQTAADDQSASGIQTSGQGKKANSSYLRRDQSDIGKPQQPHGGRVEGVVVRISRFLFHVKPAGHDGTFDQREMTIQRQNFNNVAGVTLNPGDVVRFSMSDHNPLWGYAAELVRCVNNVSPTVK